MTEAPLAGWLVALVVCTACVLAMASVGSCDRHAVDGSLAWHTHDGVRVYHPPPSSCDMPSSFEEARLVEIIERLERLEGR